MDTCLDLGLSASGRTRIVGIQGSSQCREDEIKERKIMSLRTSGLVNHLRVSH